MQNPTNAPLPASRRSRILDEMPKTISMSQLAKNAERIANDVETANTVYRIKRPGRPTMLLVSDAYMKSLKATVDFMARHPNWEAELEEGRDELAEGRAIPLEVLVAEITGKSRETPRTTARRRSSRSRPSTHRGRTTR
jgi:PHD/YefM family antitoxin component YafN of YafNO toxin-antitoxin module